MTKYIVKGQGYGGGGPSVTPFESDSISEIKDRMIELLESDHAVQLYRVNADGTVKPVEFEYYTNITVNIDD
jgi:hypothetical protein